MKASGGTAAGQKEAFSNRERVFCTPMVGNHGCRERLNAVIETLQPLPSRAAISDKTRGPRRPASIESETTIGPGDSIFVKVNVALVPESVRIATFPTTPYPENVAC
jgi:hypothetical protein